MVHPFCHNWQDGQCIHLNADHRLQWYLWDRGLVKYIKVIFALFFTFVNVTAIKNQKLPMWLTLCLYQTVLIHIHTF